MINDNREKRMSSIPKERYGVHQTHCCILHGCKYGNEDCPVASGEILQEYPCESCVRYFKPGVAHKITVASDLFQSLTDKEQTFYITDQVVTKGEALIFTDASGEIATFVASHVSNDDRLPTGLSIVSLSNGLGDWY